MEKTARLPLIAFTASILLPYGVITTSTPIMTTVQYWLFPLWIYMHDFGAWLGFGVILPAIIPSTPTAPFPPASGLIWFVIGLYTSLLLYQLYENRREARSVWLQTVVAMILQIVTTIIFGLFIFRDSSVMQPMIIPLPIYFLIVLYLVRIKMNKEIID